MVTVEADMTIFSSDIVKDSIKTGFSVKCRQVQILNGNKDGECMVIGHFCDWGLKELKLRRQKDYNNVKKTNDSIFTFKRSVHYDMILRNQDGINFVDANLLVDPSSNIFYDKKTESIIIILKSENRIFDTHPWPRIVHSNIGVYKYSIISKQVNIVSFIDGSIEQDADCAFFVLSSNDLETIYGIVIKTKVDKELENQSMIFKIYKLQLSGWVQESKSIKISNHCFRYDARNMLIINNQLYLFGICDSTGYAAHIAIINFSNGKYEIEKNMMEGQILYAAVPFGLGCRYVALFPDRSYDTPFIDTFYEHPAMMLFDSSQRTIVKLKQKISRQFYCFISYYAEDCDGFICEDVAKLVVNSWLRIMTLKELNMDHNWPSYMNNVVFRYYYLQAKVGICGLYVAGDDDVLTKSVYVSIPFDYLSCL